MNCRRRRTHTYWIVLILGLICPGFTQSRGFPEGPDGGDARTFAADPANHLHLYLGTANGWIYQSRDGGRKWARLARVDKRDDLVVGPYSGGSVRREASCCGSVGGGRSTASRRRNLYQPGWRGDVDQPVGDARPVDPVAGVGAHPIRRSSWRGRWRGVFRSQDSGAHWQRISPQDNKEIHEIESLAIDPTDPALSTRAPGICPGRQPMAAATWTSIKDGIIEDSDVFSILIDPKQPNVVYLSACSGIYKSVDGARSSRAGLVPISRRAYLRRRGEREC